MNEDAKEILTDLKNIVNTIVNIQEGDLTEQTKMLRSHCWAQELVYRSQQFEQCLIINPKKAC